MLQLVSENFVAQIIFIIVQQINQIICFFAHIVLTFCKKNELRQPQLISEQQIGFPTPIRSTSVYIFIPHRKGWHGCSLHTNINKYVTISYINISYFCNMICSSPASILLAICTGSSSRLIPEATLPIT